MTIDLNSRVEGGAVIVILARSGSSECRQLELYFGSRSMMREIVRGDADPWGEADELARGGGPKRHRVFGAVPARLNPGNRLDGRFALFVNPPAVLVISPRQHFSVTEALSDGDGRFEKQLAFPDEAR